MTIGNVTNDARVQIPVFDPWAGTVISHAVGTVVQKSWSGGDWPKTKPERPVPEERSPGLGALSRPPSRARIEEHDYVMIKTTSDTPLCRADHKSDPNMYRMSNGWVDPDFSDTFLPWSSDINLALLGRLRNRVAGSDFNAGVFLGEGRESLRLITQSATKIYNSLRLVKRGRFGDARRVLTGNGSSYRIAKYDDPSWIDNVPLKRRDKAIRDYDRSVSESWLELQYGWIPLLSDAKGAAEFLAHQHSVGLQHRVTASITQNWSGKLASNAPNDFVFARSSKRLKVRIIAKLVERDVVTLSGLTDPLSVAWELVPYSFVADWFIPVGNYLQARGLAQSLRGIFIVCFKEDITWDGLELVPSNGSNFASQWTLSGGEGGRKVRRFRNQRIIETSLPVPLPEVKPLFDVPSWKRAANAAALVSTLGVSRRHGIGI